MDAELRGRLSDPGSVRNAGSAALYDAYSDVVSFSVTGTAPLVVTGLTATSGGNPVTFPVAAGTPLTWTATATGGVAPLQYQFCWTSRVSAGSAPGLRAERQRPWTPS